MGNNQDSGFKAQGSEAGIPPSVAVVSSPTSAASSTSTPPSSAVASASCPSLSNPPLWTQQSSYFMNSSALLSSNPGSVPSMHPIKVEPHMHHHHWGNDVRSNGNVIGVSPAALVQSNGIPMTIIQHQILDHKHNVIGGSVGATTLIGSREGIVGKKRQREEDDDTDFDDFNGTSTHTTVLEGGEIDPIALSLQDDSDADGQKPSEDGFRWRKYGRKSVKGSKYPRSYYKCTYPGCQVKKQVEVIMKNESPTITTTYKGNHAHERPQVTNVRATDQQTFKNVVLDGFAKQFTAIATNSIVPANMPRLVVETSKNVNHLDDGYRWRKYGQKLVKGSKWPRSYYKCSEIDCMVKKQVDQLEDTIINIYEGTHNHHPPSADGNRRKRRKSLPAAASTESGSTGSSSTSSSSRRKGSHGSGSLPGEPFENSALRRQSLAVAPSVMIHHQHYGHHNAVVAGNDDHLRRGSLLTPAEMQEYNDNPARRQSLGVGPLLHGSSYHSNDQRNNRGQVVGGGAAPGAIMGGREFDEALLSQHVLTMQNNNRQGGMISHVNSHEGSSSMHHPSENSHQQMHPHLQPMHPMHPSQINPHHHPSNQIVNSHMHNLHQQQIHHHHQQHQLHQNQQHSSPRHHTNILAGSSAENNNMVPGVGDGSGSVSVNSLNFSSSDLSTPPTWGVDNVGMTLAPAITGNPLNFSGGAFAYVDGLGVSSNSNGNSMNPLGSSTSTASVMEPYGNQGYTDWNDGIGGNSGGSSTPQWTKEGLNFSASTLGWKGASYDGTLPVNPLSSSNNNNNNNVGSSASSGHSNGNGVVVKTEGGSGGANGGTGGEGGNFSCKEEAGSGNGEDLWPDIHMDYYAGSSV